MTEPRDLMQRYCDGDAGAFRQLHALVAPRLLGYLVKMTRDRALADDLLQQTFLKVHRARAAYVRGADPVPWIYSIAHRTFIDETRRHRRAVVRVGEVEELPEVPAGLTGESDDRRDEVRGDPELVTAALDALAELPAQQREAVVLTKLDGKSVAEAAEIAGTTIGAMKVRAHRGYEALRKLLGRSPAAPPARPAKPASRSRRWLVSALEPGAGAALEPGAEAGIDDLSRLPPPKPPALSPALEAELARLTPVATRRPLRQLALLIAISLVYGAGLVVMLTVRRDLHELPMGWLVSTGLAWLLGFVVPATLATVPRTGSVMPRWRLAGIASVVAAVAMIGLGLVLHPAGEHSALLGWDGVVRGYGCLAHGLETAIVPVVIGTIFLRRALPVGSRWVAAGLGAGGGSLGGLVLHLHCPVADGVHVGLVHGGVIAIAALLAAALMPRAIEVR